MSDERPPVWVGHVFLETDRLVESEAFMRQIGMRPIARSDEVAILEMRGGTHLVLRHNDTMTPGPWPIDLMVDDIEQTHASLSRLGLAPSDLETSRNHTWFYLEDPAGNTIKFNSTHVSDLPV